MSEDESSAKPVRKRPLRVLFIEDNPADAELCLQELKKASLEVRADVVETPEQFAERLREKSYDIILADYLLYDWTGMDAFDLLRKQGHDLPFLLLTVSLCESRSRGDHGVQPRRAPGHEFVGSNPSRFSRVCYRPGAAACRGRSVRCSLRGQDP